METVKQLLNNITKKIDVKEPEPHENAKCQPLLYND